MRIFRALQICGLAILGTAGASLFFEADQLSQMFGGLKQPINVVRVDIQHTNGNGEKGSGVLVRSDLVLTAEHVVRDAREGSVVTVEFVGGTKRQCEILKVDKKWDLALLQFASVLYPPAKPANNSAVTSQEVTICGFPHGGDYTEVSGRVVGFRSPDKTSESYWFVVNNRCESGMSGGPVFNADGEVVGTLFGTLRFANCTGLDAIKDFLYEKPIPRQAR